MTHAEATVREEFPRLDARKESTRRRVAEIERARARAREFADLHVRPRALEIDRRVGADHSYFDWDIARKGTEYGLLGMAIPKQAGGTSSGRIADTAVAIEEMCAACPGIALIFGAHGLGVGPLLVGGVAHWDTCLRQITEAERRGEPLLMAFAITEPGAGTDVENPELIESADLNTRAEKVPGGYRLNGRKCFISNGSVARWVTVFMSLDPKRPLETHSCFLVDTQSEGFSVGRIEHKLGQRASPAAEIVFDDVFVPEGALVGRVGDGVALTMLILTISRPCVGAIATGIARGAYERLREWSLGPGASVERRQYFRLAMADIETDIHLARQAYLDAAMDIDRRALAPLMGHFAVRGLGAVPKRVRQGKFWQRVNASAAAREATARLIAGQASEAGITRSLGLASLSKVVGSDVAVRTTNTALELVGLNCGPVRAELEKLWRDAKLTQIYEGTNQLNRLEVYDALCAGKTIHTLPRPSRNGRRK